MKLRTRLMGLLFFFNVSDFVLTSKLIERDGLSVEVNPFMRYLFSMEPTMLNALYYKLIAFVALVVVLEFYTRFRKGRPQTIKILIALNVLFGSVVAYSIGLLAL